MRCQLTGREPGFGNRVSHSQRKTRRRWNPNIQRKRYWVPSLNRFVTLTLSDQGHQDGRQGRHRGHRRPAARAGGEGLMAKSNDIRPIIKMRSTAGTGYTYVTRKNRRNDPDRMVLRKYDPVARKHVDFKEER